MRELAPFVLLACACGAAVRDPSPSPAMPSVASTPAAVPAASRADIPAAFDSLAARGPTLAPGMREVARRQTEPESRGAADLTKADTGDICVRVAFAATAPITARLLDQAGNVLATSEPATDGVLGPRGPVCVRKGDMVRAVAVGSASVRWVAWQAP